jgi:hypothetical protein
MKIKDRHQKNTREKFSGSQMAVLGYHSSRKVCGISRGSQLTQRDEGRKSMTLQKVVAQVLCVVGGLPFWITRPNAGLAECDNDQLQLPVSLKPGSIKTPEFMTQTGAVAIEITANNVLPPAELSCMMGISEGSQDPVDCDKEPLIEATWKVWSGSHLVAQGSSRDMGKKGYYRGNFYGKYLGAFKARKHEKYSVEVDFTKDGSALAVAEPSLTLVDLSPPDIGYYQANGTDGPRPDPDILYITYLQLAPGHFRSPQFEGHKGLNVITFQTLGRLPIAKEFCLFGIQATGLPRCDEESVVDFEWTVWSEGKVVAAGTSHPPGGDLKYSVPIDHCGGTGSIDRDIGFFRGRKGQKFSIEVNVLKDGSELNIAYPTLSVVKGYPPSAFAM